MVTYCVVLLAACVLCGLPLGDVLGWQIGVTADVGGVGFSMLLLIASSEWLRGRGALVAFHAAQQVVNTFLSPQPIAGGRYVA